MIAEINGVATNPDVYHSCQGTVKIMIDCSIKYH